MLLVEEAPQLRTGGYVIDFWGRLRHRREDGPAPPAQGVGLPGAGGALRGPARPHERRLLDRCPRPPDPRPLHQPAAIRSCRRRSTVRWTGRSRRSSATPSRVSRSGRSVRVRFDHAPPREVDLVIGADGLHSRVRQLVFGPEAGFEVSLGYHVAAFEVEGYRPRDELVYVSHAVAGTTDLPLLHARRQDALSLRLSRRVPAGAKLRERRGTQSGADERLCRCRLGVSADPRGDGERPRHLLRPGQPDPNGPLDEAAHGAGRRCRGLCLPPRRRRDRAWRWPRPTCSRASSAIAADDFGAAFARYEASLMPFLQTQAGIGGEIRLGIRAADRVRHRVPQRRHAPAADSSVADLFIGRDLRDDFAFPDYGFSAGSGRVDRVAGGRSR